jgi:hypothetical protein
MVKKIIGDEKLPRDSNFMEAEKTARLGDHLVVGRITYERIDARINKGDKWTLIKSE